MLALPKEVLDFFPMFEFRCPVCNAYPALVPIIDPITKEYFGSHISSISHCPKCMAHFNEEKWCVPPRFLKNQKAMSEYAHKVLAPKLNKMQRALLFRYFTVLFSDGFESGTILTTDIPPGAWNSKTGTPTVVTTVAREGIYSCLCNASSEFVNRTQADTEIWVRVYVYLDNVPANANEIVEFIRIRLLATGFGLRVTLINVAGTNKWQYIISQIPTTKTSDLQTNPSSDTWVCVEARLTCSATVGVTQLYVNGGELTDISLTGTNTGILSMDQVLVGQIYSNYVTNVYVDSVVMADAYIGPIVKKAKIILLGHKPHTLWTTHPRIRS